MGWDGIQNDGARRDARAHVKLALGSEERLLAAKRCGDVIYGAYWSEDNEIMGLVVLLDRSQPGWTYYKVMSETEGPVESKCPADILGLLDPATHPYAQEWRARCWEFLRSDPDYHARTLRLEMK